MKKITYLSVFFIAIISFIGCLNDEFELPESNSILDENTPNALFGVKQKEGKSWTVTFTNLSTEALYYKWDLGDGTTIESSEESSEIWFDHTFNTDVERDYTITLTATDDLGVESVFTQNFFVVEDTSPIVSVDNDIIIHSFSSFEVGGDKSQEPINTLDDDLTTEWTAEDGDIVAGDYKGDGEFIIYDLGASNNIDLIEFSVTAKFQSYGYEILTSNSGVEDADFVKLLPQTGDISFTSHVNEGGVESGTLKESLDVSVDARYIKLIGYGRFDNIDAVEPTRTSVWTNISEINFFRNRN